MESKLITAGKAEMEMVDWGRGAWKYASSIGQTLRHWAS